MSRVAVFDLGGVICDFCPELRLDALREATGLSVAEIDVAIWGSGLDRRAEAGALEPDEAFGAVLAALQDQLDRDELQSAWSRAFVINDAVADIVERVSAPTFVFTNNGPILSRCLDRELGPVLQLVDRVICSWELRAMKPDPLAFNRLAAIIGVAPSDVVFIDDALTNCDGASTAGMTAIQFEAAPQLERSLDMAGLLGR